MSRGGRRFSSSTRIQALRPELPYTTHRLSVADSVRSATKPPLTESSTPVRGMISVTAESADPDAGKIIESLPADDASGTTTSRVSVDRPAFEISTRGGVPATSAVRWPSSRASRTSRPEGT